MFLFNDIARFNLLPFIIQMPILGVLCILQMDKKKLTRNIKSVSTWISAFIFLLISILCLSADNGLSIQYKFFDFSLSTNNISLFVMEFTSFIVMICILVSKEEVTNNIKRFHILLLFLESLLLILFSTTSILIFCIILEIIIVVTSFLIGSFSKKIAVAFNFLISQLCGSIFIFLGVIYIINITGITEIYIISNYTFSNAQACIIFIMFFIGFASLSALFPLHCWFSSSQTESPTSISVFLSGGFSIIGIFGFITILMPLTKNIFLEFQEYILYLPIITMIHAATKAKKMNDLKKFISYISLIHISVITIGIFSCNINGITGAFFNMLSHSLVIPLMYIIISIIENTFGTRNVNNLSNISKSFPSLALFALIPILSLIFTPLFPCFTGFLLIIFSYFTDYFFSVIAICFISLCGTFYILRNCNNVFFGEENSSHKYTIKKNELSYLIPVLLAIITISIFQKSITRIIAFPISDTIPKNFIDRGIFE